MADVEATKAAEELASEKDVSLSEVEGSGAEGRVLKSDVEAAVADNSSDEAEDADVVDSSDSPVSEAHDTYHPDRGDPSDPNSAAAYYSRMGLDA